MAAVSPLDSLSVDERLALLSLVRDDNGHIIVDPGPAGSDPGCIPSSPEGSLYEFQPVPPRGMAGAPGTGGATVPHAKPGSAPGVDTPGFCYLAAVRPDARLKMKKALGLNPYLSEVAAWLQRNVSEHSSARFRLTVGGFPVDMHGVPAFVQAHIVEDPSGMRLKQLLNMPTVDVRLGADRQAPSEPEAGGAGRSRRTVPVGGGRTVVRIPFALTIKHTSGAVVFSPRTSSTIVGLTKYFESAELLELSVSASVAGGSTAALAVGVGTGAVAPADVDGFLGLPFMALFSGDAQGLGRGDFRLPDDHGFGREVKAVSVGNPDPVLYLRMDKATNAYAHVRGMVVLGLAGVGVPSPIILTPAAAPRSG